MNLMNSFCSRDSDLLFASFSRSSLSPKQNRGGCPAPPGDRHAVTKGGVVGVRGDLVLKVEGCEAGGTRAAEAMCGHIREWLFIARFRDGCDERSALRPPGVDPHTRRAEGARNQGMDITPRIRDGSDERSALGPPGG